MNEYDSELIRSILTSKEYQLVDSQEQAEVILLNTCAIRENAHRKIYNRLDELRGRKRRGEVKLIGILGCMAQSLRKDLAERSKEVDIIAGPDSYKRLPMLIDAATNEKSVKYDFSLSEFETYSDIAPRRIPAVNAWIAIMRGCDNFCSFCVVPYTRGRERSRSTGSIIAESTRVVAEGFKQVTLLGQNVNSYRHEEADFADLMEQMAGIAGLERVRFTSPHPKDFPRKLLTVISEHKTLCNHIHLPLQAGNDAVLARMNRTYTKQEFLDLADEIKDRIPGVALTTDIICGFSGESDSDFEDTIQVVEKVAFDSAYIFKYSERKNTIASRKMADDVPEAVKTERIVHLNEIQRNISKMKNREEVGQTRDVLIESVSRKNNNEWLGKTDQNKGVVFSAPGKNIGDFARVLITNSSTNTLQGTLVDEPTRLPVLNNY